MEHALETFVDRWSKSAGAERANYQLFLAELCDALGVPRPEPTVEDDARNAYVFERGVRFDNRDGTHSIKRIDLYKRGCFVCETKQGVEKEDEEIVLSAKQTERRRAWKKGHGTRGTAAWDDAMFRAVGQAEQYARALNATITCFLFDVSCQPIINYFCHSYFSIDSSQPLEYSSTSSLVSGYHSL